MLTHYLRKGCTNTFIFGITSFVAKGMWLVCMPFFLRMLPVHEIGIFDFYQSMFLIGSLMITSISAQPLGRFYLKYRNEQELQRTTLGTSITLALVCLGVCLSVSFLALLRYLWYGDSYFVMFMMFNVGLFACFSFVTFFAQIREQLKEYVLLYCAQSFLALAIALVSLRNGYGVSSLFWANGVSYLVCAPVFMKVFWSAGLFCKKSLYEQCAYGVPLVLYNIVYMLLFAVDRWYLAFSFGYELVGLYAVLWYFGKIFVYATMALYDASPMLFFNAQHEQEGTQIIARAIRYVTILYVTGALMIVPCAYVVLTTFLPPYSHLIGYVPLFIMSLLFVETGKFWQVGFTLSAKTSFIPVISCSTLLIQMGCLYFVGHMGLLGVMYANCFAFLSYALLNGIGSRYAYSPHLFAVRELATLFGLYGMYNLLLWCALYTKMPLVCMLVCGFSWPFTLWFGGVVTSCEKAYILQICKKYILMA